MFSNSAFFLTALFMHIPNGLSLEAQLVSGEFQATNNGEAATASECSDAHCLRDFLSGKRFWRANGERSFVQMEEFDADGDWTGMLKRSARIMLTGEWSIDAGASDGPEVCIRFEEYYRNYEFSGKTVCRKARVSESGDLIIDVLVGVTSESRLIPE